MRSKSIKYLVSVVFALACLVTFNKNVWAYGDFYQTANSDTSVTIGWDKDTVTEYKIGYAEVPVTTDYKKKNAAWDLAKSRAEKGQIKVPKGTNSYQITGLKPQTEYYIYLGYRYSTYSSDDTYTSIHAYTKIKKVTRVAQQNWYKYINEVNVSWDEIPGSYSTTTYEVAFMDAKGKKIEAKKTSSNRYTHTIKNNKIYTIKVRAVRIPGNDMKGMASETTAWSDVQYLFTQPTVTYSKLTKSSLKIKWTKISGVSSYTVFISPKQSSGYKKVKNVSAKKNSLTIKKYGKKKLSKLKKKKYYVYVVPNKKVNGRIIKKDVTYTYEIMKGTKKIKETYK